MELDLKAANLINFITSKLAEEIEMPEHHRTTLDARAIQYLRNSVTKAIASRLGDISTAFETFDYLVKNFGCNRFQEYVNLHSKFTRHRFRSSFDPIRFISDFNSMISLLIMRI